MGDDVSIWIELLKDVGIPIGITVYLLLRFERKLDKLADVVAELKKTIQEKNRKGECIMQYGTKPVL